jgi:hypothetical protein
MGCTEATGRSWDCHTRCDGYKEFQAKNEEEKNVIKKKNPYYKSLSKEKFMKRNALNRNRTERKQELQRHRLGTCYHERYVDSFI